MIINNWGHYILRVYSGKPLGFPGVILLDKWLLAVVWGELTSILAIYYIVVLACVNLTFSGKLYNL